MSLHIGATKAGKLHKRSECQAIHCGRNSSPRIFSGAVRYSEIRNMYGYTGTCQSGVPVSVQGSGMGMSMGIYSFELFSEYEVEKHYSHRYGRAFHEDINVGDILLLSAWLPPPTQITSMPSRFLVSIPFRQLCLLTKVINAGAGTGIAFKAGNTVSQRHSTNSVISGEAMGFNGRAGGRNGSGSPYMNAAWPAKKTPWPR